MKCAVIKKKEIGDPDSFKTAKESNQIKNFRHVIIILLKRICHSLEKLAVSSITKLHHLIKNIENDRY